ncbi:translation initiation factor IF-2 associated domain-containing protein, partial [Bartonella sp. AP58NXGY]|uniref:translation initiation factor IF-2 associated domain-containing protein n=1 Tax=Bartonella sp. AP58NXGY TaxID=3243498 RepID=UPI0035CEF47B
GKKTLTLKRSVLETSTVKQNFSHGRTKAVVVETKRRKITRPDEKAETLQPITKPHVAPQRSKPRFEEKKPQESVTKSNLSSAEMEARLRALEEAHIQERIMREQAEKEAKRAKEREEILKQEIKEKEILQKQEEEKSPVQIPPVFSEPPLIEETDIPLTPKNTTVIEKRKIDENKEEERYSRRANPAKSEIRAPKIVKGADERRRGKLTLNSALDEEGSARGRSMAAMRRRQEKFKRAQN